MNWDFDINSIAQWLPVALLVLTVLDRLGIHTPVISGLLRSLAAAMGKTPVPTPAEPSAPAGDPLADHPIIRRILDRLDQIQKPA